MSPISAFEIARQRHTQLAADLATRRRRKARRVQPRSVPVAR